MGAATALLHAPRDPLIDAIIADSPFADLHQLIEEIVEVSTARGAQVPPSPGTGQTETASVC